MYFLTIGNGEVCLVIPPGLVSEFLSNVHVRVNLLSHLLQHRGEVILPVVFIQNLQHLGQLDFSAVVPRLLAFILTVFLSETDQNAQVTNIQYRHLMDFKLYFYV